MSNILSYTNILKDIINFKNSGTNHGSEFNIYDMPSHKYFKILFYFGDGTINSNEEGNANGLLHPTWELFSENSNLNYYDYNSAWSFLKLNDENERAEKLKKFVTLLSDINSLSPWYFSSIGGLESALERKVAEDGRLDMSETKKLTISCLPDAFDNRIGTMLELYRDVTWSWVHKKEVIPANLRKFDMAIYIFEAPERSWHNIKNNEDIIIGMNNGNFRVSYKMIEFHDCEINYNSIKSGWSELNNETGFTPKYTIDISYNDCYEISYNDIMMRQIGDIIVTDLFNTAESKQQENSYTQEQEIDDRTNIVDVRNKQETNESKQNSKITTYLGNLGQRTGAQKATTDIKYKINYEPGFITNAIGQVAGTAVADVKSLFKKAVLGNLYGFSLTRVGDYAKDVLNGNLLPVLQKSGVNTNKYASIGGQSIKDFMKNIHGTKENASSAYDVEHQIIERTNPLSEKNIHEGDKASESIIKRTNPLSEKNMHEGDKASESIIERTNPLSEKNIHENNKKDIVNSPKKSIGNIFKSSTIANNI